MTKTNLRRITPVILSAAIAGCGGSDAPTGVPIFTLGGTVYDLNGTAVLQLNGADTLTLNESGTFTFAGTRRSKSTYDVTVLHHPHNSSCKIENNKGTITDADVTNIVLRCHYPSAPVLSLESSLKQLRFHWQDNTAEHYYQLYENADGKSGYSLIADDIVQSPYHLDVPVHKLDWPNASYILHTCLNEICSTESNTVATLKLDTNSINYLKSSTPAMGDRFGSTLALSGDGTTLAIASPTASITVNTNTFVSAGKVDILERISGEWTAVKNIQLDNPSSGHQFGTSLAISNNGDTLAIGAPGENGNSGSVYVYSRPGNTWSSQSALVPDSVFTPTDLNPGDRFGVAVSLNEDDASVLAVGANHQGPATWSGSVYLYNKNNGVWNNTTPTKLKPSDSINQDLYGSSIKLNATGTLLAVGAPGKASDAKPRSGAVYIYTYNNATWQQSASLKPAIHDAGDNFGFSIDMSATGDLLAIAAPYESSNATGINGDESNNTSTGSGAVYIFQYENNVWKKKHYIKASNNNNGDNFGLSVALNAAGDELVVGAPYEASAAIGINGEQVDNNSVASGAAYFFTFSDNTWKQFTYIKASNTDSGDLFGRSTGMDNTGNTLAIGATAEASNNNDVLENNLGNNDLAESGAVYLY